MALNWTVEDIKDYESVCWIEADWTDDMRGIKPGDKVLNPVTDALIWLTMVVGIGTITEKNASEFLARVRIFEGLNGPMLTRLINNEIVDQPITAADVAAHIGLHTNASKNTKTEFLNFRYQRAMEDAASDIRKALSV